MVEGYLCNLAGLSRPGALQYDVIGETWEDDESSTPPLLSTSPPCFMYTKKIDIEYNTYRRI